MTRSKNFVEAEDEESVVYKEQMGEKISVEVKENDVKGKENQEKGKKIMVQNKRWRTKKKYSILSLRLVKETQSKKNKVKIKKVNIFGRKEIRPKKNLLYEVQK